MDHRGWDSVCFCSLFESSSVEDPSENKKSVLLLYVSYVSGAGMGILMFSRLLSVPLLQGSSRLMFTSDVTEHKTGRRSNCLQTPTKTVPGKDLGGGFCIVKFDR